MEPGQLIQLSRQQGIRLVSIAVLLKHGEIEILGGCARSAVAEIVDIGEEIALQLSGLPDGDTQC